MTELMHGTLKCYRENKCKCALCRKANRDLHKIWRENNREKSRTITKKSSEKKRDVIRAGKNKPCADCGKSYPYYVMEYDHVRGRKEHDLTRMRCFALSKILEEMAKCDVVCSNCHAERSFVRLMDKSLAVNGL